MSPTLLRGALGAALLVLLGTAQAERREVRLEQAALAATEQGRADLKYLSYCALDHQTTLVAEHAGQRWTFPGQVGLAPRWHAQPLSVPEQHWVSACMLAMTNHEGVQVQISLHLPTRPNAGVRDGWLDRSRQYEVAEGRYFGNLFATPQRSYVCGDPLDDRQKQWLESRHRLCAIPGSERDAQGRPLSVCGFVHVGRCEPAAYSQDGTDYAASVQVYLPKQLTR